MRAKTMRECRQRVDVAVFRVPHDREYSALHSTQSPAHVFTLSVARFDTLMSKSVEKSSPQKARPGGERPRAGLGDDDWADLLSFERITPFAR